ncbi:hypothetical protein D9757_003471 [Collybiopsis confluens]|uniref:Mitochondrial outer membrane protein IML2 n=1 Tax=Collybiopsis confluens TaxID=2823264 RepID=A0A8H5HTE3_9AGAR|nr:hypothetical protein D9757_003471 [Collybiopsis confluens]
MAYSAHETAAQLASASLAFDHLFSNEISSAKKTFATANDPFHLIGLGVCSFLEAALGLEASQMSEASRLLALAETGSKLALKAATKQSKSKASAAFPPGFEFEIVNADATVLLGITHALRSNSESFTGYLQCIYAMNNAHSKFRKLYTTVFPNGLTAPVGTSSLAPSSWTPSATPSPAGSPALTPKTSSSNLSESSSSGASFKRPPAKQSSSFFSFTSRWGSGMSSTSSLSLPSTPGNESSASSVVEEASAEEIQNLKAMIVAGTAFGFGLFNLVFSLLPKRAQSVAGLFGYAHSRPMALQALALSADYAAEGEIHGVFAGLVLMTYHGVVLLLSGYQADEQRILREYESIVTRIEARYPKGALWILNRAKILRMSYDPQGAIRVLTAGLEVTARSGDGEGFKQADTLLMFELAWTYLSERRYVQSADAFIKLTDLNSWSHGTYYFIAAGCHVGLALTDGISSEEKEKHLTRAQELLDTIPSLLDKRKVGGKELPTEVLIKKKLAFYKEKQKRWGGDEKKFVECIRISPAEELGIFWNNHSRISAAQAQSHIQSWSALSPPVGIDSSYMTKSSIQPSPSATHDLDTPDEVALRFLLLGIMHRVLGCAGYRKHPTETNETPSTADAAQSGLNPEDENVDHYIANASTSLRASRDLLNAAHALQPSIKMSTWIGGVALFELAVLDLKEAEVEEQKLKSQSADALADLKKTWHSVLKSARAKLDSTMALATNSVDLSSRLDSRAAMLRDEIGTKAEILGLTL